MTEHGRRFTATPLKLYFPKRKGCDCPCGIRSFIVLAEYDPSDDTFLVLDSAPGDSGNTGDGVAWLSPSSLNRSGNSRMHVDWWCLLETTISGTTVGPYMENGEL